MTADSGRPIRNGNAIVYVPGAKPSGNYIDHSNYDNNYVSFSGYNGIVTESIYASRFNDVGYYDTAHSGFFYGGSTLRDIRQT